MITSWGVRLIAVGVGAAVAGTVFSADDAAFGYSGNPVAGNQGFTVVGGDAAVSGNENEGTLAVGGDLALMGNYRVALQTAGTFTADGDARPTALVVGGKADWATSSSGGLLQVLTQGVFQDRRPFREHGTDH